MEAKREAGVWSRVAAPIQGGQSREELRILLMNAGELLELVQSIAGKTAKGRGKLRQMLEWEQENIHSLKGMLVFSGQEAPIPKRSPAPVPVKQSLIRGYYLAKKGAAEYTARSVDPEFGVVYQEMAQREIQICNLITKLLGEIFL